MWYFIARVEVTYVTDHATTGDDERGNHVPQLPEEAEGPSVEAYETEDGVVLYDADNPLAWLKADNATPIAALR